MHVGSSVPLGSSNRASTDMSTRLFVRMVISEQASAHPYLFQCSMNILSINHMIMLHV